ncbi:MAG: DeoR/GlpR family DNA-binding transcription regulator [Meiothermus sp.]|nr:DeoR/GlpR family DNA-binding transcription regulator [Meiothermus sp.]
MVPSQRKRRILEQLLIEKTIPIRDLAARMEVHEITIRRDLGELEKQGLVEMVRGGARLVEQAQTDVAYEMRSQRDLEAKRLIAREALKLISEGDTVALDASTTSLELARIIGVRERVHVLVSSLDAANVLAASKVTFSIIGGTFNPAARGFSGPISQLVLGRLHPDKAFFSSKGLSQKSGFSDASLVEAEVKTQLIRAAKSAIALVDGSKFGGVAFSTIVGLEHVDALITDREPDPALRKWLLEGGVKITIAKKTTKER